MKQPKIEIATEPQPHEVEFVLQQIIKFNSSRASEGNYKHLVIFLRDSDDHIVGGLIGETYWQWLYVDVLWVHELFRGEGYGDILLATAEQEAVKRGCQYAYLDTFSFQAPEFYRKRGYVVFGELPNFPQGYSRFFLKKELQ
ncbi:MULTISPECIES: GNAT family N-acetyltransferase [Fischerella]|uniref:GNAT family N-acetyltransferase n=1 Tax=Fischerella muscicola CCMEE 5323 TaxID=2019572 RepID=A0A2N6K6H3_FISMU|nr:MULTISPECIES: GNAT family N-acetyltransferase [Fischerella]MBD2434092.1 GNAT family N-acetyltransferase [Fischerella sp. FACHB-380]PLZ92472.1 GNAT family N-acetyltransferase [Fischerella muscicola CCMEE 5323]